MCTEAARRSQEAIDSARGPSPRTWDIRLDPETGESLPTRPLTELRRADLLMIASFAPAALLALLWLASREHPDGAALAWAGGLGLYFTLLNLQSSGGGLAGFERARPQPWPRDTAVQHLRRIHVAGYAAGAAAACAFVVAVFTQDQGDGALHHHWAVLGILLGLVTGPALALLQTVRAERRLNVRLYREPQAWPAAGPARRAGRITYAGPPPADAPGYSSSSSQSPARSQ